MRTSPPIRARVVLLGCVLVAVVLALRDHSFGDVEVYRAGGRAALSGGNLYGFRIRGDGFTYPPFAALLFTGVAWLPVPLMWAAMVVLSAPALVTVVRLSAPHLVTRFRRGELPAALTLGALVLAQPVTGTLRWGQVDLDLAALVLVDLVVLRRGYLVGLATAIKLTPGLFIVYLLVRGRRREALGAVTTFGAIVVVGALLLPAQSARFWLHNMMAASGVGGLNQPNNDSIRGLAEQLFGAGTGTHVWMVLVPLVVVVGLVLANRLGAGGYDILSIAVVGVTMCLVSPVSWTHHWVWVIPLLVGQAGTGRAWRAARTAGFGLVVFWTFARPEWLEAGRWRPLDTGYVLAALMLGLVAGAQVIAHRYRRPTVTTSQLVRATART